MSLLSAKVVFGCAEWNNETGLCKGSLSLRELFFSPLSLRFLFCEQEVVSSQSETVTAKILLQGAWLGTSPSARCAITPVVTAVPASQGVPSARAMFSTPLAHRP